MSAIGCIAAISLIACIIKFTYNFVHDWREYRAEKKDLDEMEAAYFAHMDQDITCADCIHNNKPWHEESCNSCCYAHNGFEPKEEEDEE